MEEKLLLNPVCSPLESKFKLFFTDVQQQFESSAATEVTRENIGAEKPSEADENTVQTSRFCLDMDSDISETVYTGRNQKLNSVFTLKFDP